MGITETSKFLQHGAINVVRAQIAHARAAMLGCDLYRTLSGLISGKTPWTRHRKGQTAINYLRNDLSRAVHQCDVLNFDCNIVAN